MVGLPLTVFRWNDEHDVAVLEMGMNAPGEIFRLTEIARPDVGLVTNVTAAHLEKLRTVDQVARAKAELFEAIGLEPGLVAEYFKGTSSRIGGVGLETIAAEALARHRAGFDPWPATAPELDFGGEYQHRLDGEHHLSRP